MAWFAQPHIQMDTLETQRLVLRRLAADQLGALHQLLLNDSIKRHLCDDRDLEFSAVLGFLEASDALYTAGLCGLWLLRPRESEDFCGFCGLIQDERLEVIYALHPSVQGRGLATEAMERVLAHIRALPTPPGPDALFARIDEANRESGRVLERLGFACTGESVNPTTGGRIYDYALTLSVPDA